MRIHKKIQFFIFLIKLILLLFFGLLFYNQVFIKNDPDEFYLAFKSAFLSENLIFFIIAFMLVTVNWGLEAAKFKLLISIAFPHSYKSSIKNVLIGIASGIITPMQVGDYFGRIISVKKEKMPVSLVSTFLSSYSQNLTTLIFGFAGIVYYSLNILKIENSIIFPSVIIGFSMIVFFLLLYFNINIFSSLLIKLGLKSIIGKYKLNYYFDIFTLNRKVLSRIFCLSLFRYSIFAVQFFLLLKFYGIKSGAISLFSSISSIFLLQSGIPFPPIVNFIMKGEISVMILKTLVPNEILILSISLCIWIINLVFPAFVGFILLIKTNVTKNLGYAD